MANARTQTPMVTGRENTARAARSSIPSAGPGGPSTEGLERYFDDLKGYGVLSAEAELSLAKEIEACEVALWQALLAHGAALDVMAKAFEEQEVTPPAEFERARRSAKRGGAAGQAKPSKARDKQRDGLAWSLRDSEDARASLPDVTRAVRVAFVRDRSMRSYLGHVREAERALTASKHRLASCNLRLVVSMARRYGQSLLPLTDLVQEGNLGLLRAVDGFDYRKGFRFSTYASWWIRHALNRGLSDRGRLVRVPVHAMEGASRIMRLRQAHLARTGSEATVEELAAQLDMPPKKLVLLREPGLALAPVSLDRKLGDDSNATMMDMLPDDEDDRPDVHLESADTHKELEGLMQTLPAIEADILRSRFGLLNGEEETLREIGERYNLSRERIRQLEQKALHTLRGAFEAEAAAH